MIETDPTLSNVCMIEHYIHHWQYFEILYVQFDHDRLVELGYQPDEDIQNHGDKKSEMGYESGGESSVDYSDEKESDWELV